MALLLLLLLLPVFLRAQPTTAAGGFSLELELIHRDSIHSPLYPGNLTSAERVRRIAEMTRSRTEWLKASIGLRRTDGIRPVVAHDWLTYLVKVGIGSPPADVHLLLDTGSDTVWTQCHPCHPCFPQDPPMFHPGHSETYHPLPRGHPLCHHYADGECRFEEGYLSGKETSGALATEKFTFAASSGGSEAVSVVFGCAHSSSENMFPASKKIGGILGLGRGPKSLATQLHLHRFSYCLVRLNEYRGISYLRFGNDIAVRGHAQTTTLVQTNHPTTYHLDLLDISVNGRRLSLPAGTFAAHSDGTGGCIIDSGVGYTTLLRPAYDRVREALEEYFSRHEDIRLIDGGRGILNLCYHIPVDFDDFPPVTFHFRGADLRLEGENVFNYMFPRTEFCFMMEPDDHLTILGVVQQQNIRFVYDIGRSELTFAPEDCSRN